MKKKVLIEGIFLLILSLVCMGEAFRLITSKEPQPVYDVLGPAYYVLFLGISLMIIGLIHLIFNYKKNFNIQKDAVSGEMRIRMISIVVVIGIYVFLINIVGYIAASLLFFFLEFRILGVKSLPMSVILTLCVTAVYYLVFIEYCHMIFPRGIFF